jgi:hypothetical protein
MMVGGDAAYVDDVFSTALYKGTSTSPPPTQTTPKLLSAPGVTTFQFLQGGTKLCARTNVGYAMYEMTIPYDILTISDTATVLPHIASGAQKVVGPNEEYLYSASGNTFTEWQLTTPGDPSTAVATGNTATYTSPQSELRGLNVSPDGLQLTLLSTGSGFDYLIQLTMTTPFDLSTATQTATMNVDASGINNPWEMNYNSDGTEMYIAEYSNISRWSLTTPYDITTATFVDLVGPASIASTTYWDWADNGHSYIVERSDVFYKFAVPTPYSLVGHTHNLVRNGVNLADKGGLVWTKARNNTYGHVLFDSEMAPESFLSCDGNASIYLADAQGSDSYLSLNSDGYSIGKSQFVNESPTEYVSWTFAKQKGFFDVVTWAGDGVAGREIAHNLGSTPGMIIVKCLTDAANWRVYHTSLGADYWLELNEASVSVGPSDAIWNSTEPTSTVFTTGSSITINGSGRDYVAYVFAHDVQEFGPDGNESIIKCGSFPGSSQTIDLGWEPQYVLMKPSNGAGPWTVLDSMRGWTGYGVGGNQPLRPNESSAEINNDASLGALTSTGFSVGNVGTDNYIYMAVRRPMKPANEFQPDELFAMDTGDNTGSASVPEFISNFPVDMAWMIIPSGASDRMMSTRLNQGLANDLNKTGSSVVDASQSYDYTYGWHGASEQTYYQSWMFRRAPGFFSVGTHEGDGATSRAVPHSLGEVPEMMWIKAIDAPSASGWICYHKGLSAGNVLILDTSVEAAFAGIPDPAWTDSDFTVGNHAAINSSGVNYMTMMWASVPGVQDIGSYTGTGADLNIDCGFTNGARFVMIKRTDVTGDWYCWDTVRGIVTGNDPALSLNTTLAHITTIDYIDPLASGFTVTATGLNASGGNYIYWAIA